MIAIKRACVLAAVSAAVVVTGVVPATADSVNNDGVFSNVDTASGPLKILNRPKVDQHTDSDASSANTADDFTDSL